MSPRGVRREPPKPDRAAMVVRAAWSIAEWRGDARTVSERMRQLRAAGRVYDERYFEEQAA